MGARESERARLIQQAGVFPRLSSSSSGAREKKYALSSGFTLVEMLVVIAIIGLLAALVVGGIGIATTKMRQSRAEAERDGLVTAIDSYKKARGFYPPDNTNDPVCVQNEMD